MIAHDKLIKIVGKANVLNDQAVLDSYSFDMSFMSPIRPECVVKPGSAEDVKKIVQIARETLTPLVPVSSGPPHFRGDTIPGTGGAVVVDLSGMKKIIRVDRENRVAMFEPGVTFGELIPAVTKEGLRLNMPLQPRATKSVAASMLEREPVVMPQYHWDIADPMNCVEIYFGTGAMFRTGAAAGPGNIEEQWAAGGAQVEAAGPSSNSWYRIIQGSQGTMGIITWASARCEILPRYEQSFFVGTSEIDRALDMMHWLVRLRIANECFTLNGADLATLIAKKWPADYRAIKEGLPQWIVFYNLAGYDYLPEERVEGRIIDAGEVAQKLQLEPVRAIGGVSATELLKLAQSPSKEPYWKLRYKGGCQDIMFLTINDRLPELVDTMYAMADYSGYPATDIGVYIQPLVQGSNTHCEFNIFYDSDNARESEKVKELTERATKELMNRGAFFSRPYGETTDIIMNRDAATVNTLKKVKRILDPENIMNPGKLCF
jgi:FAD/FMN-containing dehydrogenase